MSPFGISAAAIAEIWKRFQESGYAHPVGSIGQASPPSPVSKKLQEALQAGVGDEELLGIGQQEFEGLASGLQFQLTVFVYDASDCRPEEVVDVSGVRLVMSSATQHALRGLTLDFGSDGFSLLGSDGKPISLSQR